MACNIVLYGDDNRDDDDCDDDDDDGWDPPPLVTPCPTTVDTPFSFCGTSR